MTINLGYSCFSPCSLISSGILNYCSVILLYVLTLPHVSLYWFLIVCLLNYVPSQLLPTVTMFKKITTQVDWRRNFASLFLSSLLKAKLSRLDDWIHFHYQLVREVVTQHYSTSANYLPEIRLTVLLLIFFYLRAPFAVGCCGCCLQGFEIEQPRFVEKKSVSQNTEKLLQPWKNFTQESESQKWLRRGEGGGGQKQEHFWAFSYFPRHPLLITVRERI